MSEGELDGLLGEVSGPCTCDNMVKMFADKMAGEGNDPDDLMSHFSQEACQTMIKMFDVNLTGTIEIDEFGKLFEYIQQWKGMFEGFDRDRRGVLDEREFSQALQQMGYRFSPTFVQNLLSKLSPRERQLTLDNFIVVCVQIRRLTDSFRSRDSQMAGTVSFMYEDFIGLAM